MPDPDTPAPALPGCSDCELRALCLPAGLSRHTLARLASIVAAPRPVPRGQALFRTGQPLRSLYAVRSGSFKTCLGHAPAHHQVTGFPMAGDLLGLDGIGSAHHSVDAIALAPSQVCAIPYLQLAELAHESRELQRQLHRSLSREIVRDHGVMRMLGGMRADERLAAFLLDLTRQLQARGRPAAPLVLRMTRAELGSHLGLKLETVSRSFSRLQDDGLLAVRQRRIRILDAEGLARLAGGAAA
ncbi:MAG: helix-turn-helix domain-containing protein [Burkholderiales bacterium]|nr:helix-turn-helix domain-containing protein [Burkholderiales bacterium]